MTISNVEEARRIAQAYLDDVQVDPPTELAILEGSTLEREFGWVFFWNSKHYIETGDFSYALVGGGPLIVDRTDGTVHQISSALPLEAALAQYRQERAQASQT
ncbi:MAG: hypothetical protein JOZ32_02215 [Bryobacterales bacterium]|nr:hypothetical protein [Bryobacterales bacterium]